jgi:hypothetical protein
MAPCGLAGDSFAALGMSYAAVCSRQSPGIPSRRIGSLAPDTPLLSRPHNRRTPVRSFGTRPPLPGKPGFRQAAQTPPERLNPRHLGFRLRTPARLCLAYARITAQYSVVKDHFGNVIRSAHVCLKARNSQASSYTLIRRDCTAQAVHTLSLALGRGPAHASLRAAFACL